MACPRNSILYNGTHCACPAGFLLNRATNSCAVFAASSGIETDSGPGVDYFAVTLPETFFSFDTLKKFTKSQAVFLEATLVMLLSWLFFCLFLRFMKHDDGSSIWFRIRWWLSRLDVCFATRHWLDDQKLVVKRKTELGGTFSIASWILFTGLFAALLYQVISKRTIEVHNVRATNAPDLASFTNDMEFEITTVSSMSCLNLRVPTTLVSGSSGFINQKVTPLSSFLKYSCRNTSMGPAITFRCNNCRLTQDYMSISWQFVDLPNNPASAVGFQFNLTATDHANSKHVSFVRGTLKNGSNLDNSPVTFRGADENILIFNLFPRIYRNLHDLRLIQPLFHEFVPGSVFNETSQLQASLGNSNDGLINTTLYINYLSAYVIEIESQTVMGLVSFLADLGGLYCISIGIFLYLLVQFEYRIKKLRNEDTVLRGIRNRRKAQEHWDKLRKYVMYTWGSSIMNDDHIHTQKGTTCCSFMTSSTHSKGPFPLQGSSRKPKQQNIKDAISFNKKVSFPSEKNTILEHTQAQEVKSSATGTTSNSDTRLPSSRSEPPLKRGIPGPANGKEKHFVPLLNTVAFQHQAFSLGSDIIPPPPPPLELKDDSEVEMSDIKKNFQRLYEYNVMLREKFVATQSLLHALAATSLSPATESHK
ncbi:hypothetical protein SLE2022_131650 [Rubroshorea leprosula]